MNKQNLDILFHNYISHFHELNNPEHEEKYKWDAIGVVQDNWKLDADNFADMLRKAFSDSHTLLNNRIVQPFSGLAALADVDPEFVRDAFAQLLVDDGGNINLRQKRILAFIDSCNAMLEKHFPKKWKYAQDMRSVICYLGMLRPEENYLFKSTPAHSFARYMEYGDDIGAGSSFSLNNYYRMCDQLIEYAKTSAELLKTDAGRDTLWKDPSLHVLAYDLIYCFDAYKLHDGMKEPPVKTKASGAQQRAYRMEQAVRIQAELEVLQDQIDELEAAIAALPKYVFTGEALKTRAFGIVEIQRQEENYLYFEAKGRSMTFVLPGCIANGFLVCNDAELIRRYKNEHEMSERIKALELQQKVKIIELNQYQS